METRRQKVSVCIASYNGAKHIKSQLLSILCQLDEQDEIIISDDNSSDDTREIIELINDKRIYLTLNQGKSGPVGNFEQSFRKATGDIIYVADQDDIWEKDKIETTKSILIDYDLVLTDCSVVRLDGSIIHNSFFDHRGSYPGFWRNLYKNSYIGCCMIFKREVLEYVLPIPKKVHMHDWWIGLLLERRGKVFFYRKPLIKYVRHGHNASPTGEGKHGLFKQLMNRAFILYYIVKRLYF